LVPLKRNLDEVPDLTRDGNWVVIQIQVVEKYWGLSIID
jgi:hypothetical protein